MNYAHYTSEQRKELLLSELKSGKIASVRWSTAKKGITTRNVKLWIESALASGDRNVVSPPANTKENHVNVVDMGKFNSGGNYPWATIDVNTLEEVKVGGKVYKFV